MKKRIVIIILVFIIIGLTTMCVITLLNSNNKKNGNNSYKNILSIRCQNNACTQEIINNRKAKENVYTNDTVGASSNSVIGGRDNQMAWRRNTVFRLMDSNDVLVPGKHGNYDFYIDNKSDDSVVYMITFVEENEAHANILYKLKRNDEYIYGNEEDWVHYNEMDFNNRVLETAATDSYSLEWRWVDAPNDTEVGMTENATYNFGMNVVAYEERDTPPPDDWDDQFEDDPEEEPQDEPQDTPTEPTVPKEEQPGEVKGEEEHHWFNPRTGDAIYCYVALLILSIIALIVVIRYKGK